MKAYTKKILSSVLAIATLINSAALASAYTEEPVDLKMIYIESEEPSEYGYIAEKYVDENGNEVTLSEPEEKPALNCFSLESTPLPTSYDAREDGFVTSAKSQGSTNNCWVFSTINAIESASIAKGYSKKESTDFSEAHLAWFACRPNTNGAADGADGDGVNYKSPYMQGGNTRMATAALARRSGVANEELFPFGSISSMGNYGEEDRFNTSGGVILESAQKFTDMEDIKNWIKKYGSVSAAFFYNVNYYNTSKATYYCQNQEITNHQITVIGWDDSYPASEFTNYSGKKPAHDGAWICQNSWGSNWGKNGCFAISYYDATLTDFVGFSVTSADRYYKNYTHNGDTSNVSVSASVSELAAANVFVADGYEKLTSVSAYTELPGTFVRINIYKNLPENYSNPTEGEIAATIEQSVDNSGFHTFYTDEKIELEPDEIFSIVIYYYHYSGNVLIPLERTRSTQSYHSDKGESYLLLNTNYNFWKEASYYGFCNAMIQASTECAHPEKETTVTEEASCDKEGTVSEICIQCGDITSTKAVSKPEHSFGEWSEYTLDGETNMQISHRECSECGTVQNRSYNPNNSGKTTVNFYEFLSFFFAKFFEIFRLI